jgi:metallo-beta-lactamase family protein
VDQLLEWIEKTCLKKRGKLIIPAFSVGRTQEILYALNQLDLERRLPEVPYYVDSPLSIKATEIVKHYPEYFNPTIQRVLETDHDPFSFPGLSYIKTVEESKLLNFHRDPCVIISASGMATGGRVLHHLIAMLPHSQNSIVFAGHQVEGTRGSLLINGMKQIRIYGSDVNVFANIVHMEELSAHADRDELISWLKKMPCKPKKVFVVHGEQEAAGSLQQIIRDEMHWSVEIPEHGHTEILS